MQPTQKSDRAVPVGADSHFVVFVTFWEPGGPISSNLNDETIVVASGGARPDDPADDDFLRSGRIYDNDIEQLQL